MLQLSLHLLNNLFNNSCGSWAEGKNTIWIFQDNPSQRWRGKKSWTVGEHLGKKTHYVEYSGSKCFYGTEDYLLYILDSVTQAETTQLQHLVLLLCSLSDTLLTVHTPEPGRWSVTQTSTLLICNAVFCVRVCLCVHVVKWGVISSVPGRPWGEKIAFCRLWKVVQV